MMKIFVAGATGVIGRRLVPMLVERGHAVIAMTRSESRVPTLSAMGATPVVADALAREVVLEVVRRHEPEVIIHQLTGLAGVHSYRNFDAMLGATNRLRTEGTDNLLAAARATGVRRFVAQSFGGWTYERAGSSTKSEDDPLDPAPPRTQRRSLAAVRYLERAVVGADDLTGIALRYGFLYGPGTNLGPDGEFMALARKRMLPIIGSGAGIWSFLHVDDGASAAIAAVERGARGVYNVADDDPAPVAVWLPEFARVAGARPPLHLPEWLGYLLAGAATVSTMTRIRGMSNEKAQQKLQWRPAIASWRKGFVDRDMTEARRIPSP